MTTAPKMDLAELEKALAYYKKRLDELGGENLKKDYEISGLRKEVTQKRKAFSLLSDLFKIIGEETAVPAILATTTDKISGTLGMDRVFVLTATETVDVYKPTHWAGREGLDEAFVAVLPEKKIAFPSTITANNAQFLLVHGKTEITEELRLIRDNLGAPYFAAVPIIADQEKIGIILMGRIKEAGVIFPAMDMGDVETLQSIAGLIASVIQNLRVGVLQETDRLKTEFFANISHEFRTPITLTVGPLEGLYKGRYGQLPDKAKAEIERMLRSQRRLLSLVNQILDLAKMESGSMKFTANRVRDLNHFVQRRVDQFLVFGEQRGIELKVEFDPAVNEAPVYLDLEKFDKVVFNLLSNACKFTKSGFVKISTRLESDHIILEVEDSGIGIRPDQLGNIFERFKQADGSASREYAGTGIGLALVKQIIESHRGTISVRSEFGKGTVFSAHIPLGKKHLEEDSVSEDVGDDENEQNLRLDVLDLREGKATEKELESVAAHNQAQLAALDASRPTLLYVDDNMDLRQFVSGLLVNEFNVFLGVNGQHGLELASQYNVDLILSDLMMPVMTGAEFLNKAKDDLKLKEIPFMILTAKSDIDSKVGELERGADDYLGKPFSEAELLARIRNLIKIRTQQRYIKRELQAARRIQQSLIPPTSQDFGKFQLEAIFNPSEELSGDFFDSLVRENHLYFYLADVTSHGTAAAQVTYLLKGLFQELVAKSAATSAVVSMLAEAMKRFVSFNLDYAVGLQFGRLDLTTGKIEYCTSNAPAPVLVEADAITTVQTTSGPLLDAKMYDPNFLFPSNFIQLKEGEHLFLFTDGCFEFRAEAGGILGERRLAKLIDQFGRRETWRENILTRLIDLNKSNLFEDDVTMLRLSWKTRDARLFSPKFGLGNVKDS